MSEEMASSVRMDIQTAHDFNNERLAIMVIGGYVLLRDSASHFVLNVLYLSSVFLVYVYLIVMAVLTIIFTSFEKVIMVKAIQTICLLLVGIALPGSKLLTDEKMKEALEVIKSGVHQYTSKVPDEEYYNIKKRRVDQIRNLMSWITKLCFSCAISNTFFIPLMQMITIKDSSSEDLLNPYLPLPLYMPFDTRTYLGYGIAFVANGIFFFFLYASINCLIETYLSCSLQLIAQLEILNYSIMNIEKRAYLKLLKANAVSGSLFETESLYDNIQFQNELYLSLRENILHHQAILRLSKSVGPFLEAINSICILSFSIVLAASIILILENPALNFALISTLTSDVYCYYEMCRVGQVITDKSADVKFSLYSTPWPPCWIKFKVLLKMFLSNTQKPIVIKAYGFNGTASLETYSDMMTLGYKIMSVLRR